VARRSIVFFFILLVSTGGAWCCHTSAQETQRADTASHNGNMSGTIYVEGNEPFVHLELETEQGKHYRIAADSSTYRALWQLQGKHVSLVGNERQTQIENIFTVKSFETK